MSDQTVLFTIIPRGITLGPGPLPVSVIVSPRLRGESKLGAYPDWVEWTRLLQQRGLTLVIRCGANTREFTIDREALQPQLWAQLFNESTFVRSYEYKDYSQRGLLTYSVRDTLSAIKTIYQEAAVELALPVDTSRSQEEHGGNRGKLAEMLSGLEVNWDGKLARRWRAGVRRHYPAEFNHSISRRTRALDGEGLYIAPRDPSTFQSAALPFAVFHHMPTPPQKDNPVVLDTDTAIDFHQALSSLNSYPALLRALGLVFDLELPADFVAQTDPGKFGALAVAQAAWDWALPTTSPELETAYVHLPAGTNSLFLTAPLILKEANAPYLATGLIALDPTSFGLAQVDVDGAMHKAIMTAETMHDSGDRNEAGKVDPEAAPHPDVFDSDATLPSLRSGGFSLWADERGIQLLANMGQSKEFNNAVEGGGAQQRPFFAEDLLRGYRLDVWDSHTNGWHSLHRRVGKYQIGEESFAPGEEEGFVQTAAMQPAPGAAEGEDGEDIYLHEAIARWAGWSLSVPMPGKFLTHHGDPAQAIPTDEYATDQPDTPFKMTVSYDIAEGSLPRLAFGRRYRLRARAVDLAGNSLAHDDPVAAFLSLFLALPRNLDGQPYLRYEPVDAPLVVIREPAAVTGPGSAVDRLVIRTFNAAEEQDGAPADTAAGDRHLLPPRTSVEMGERLGMFDDATGKLKGDAATWQLIVDRDAGELNQQTIAIAGQAPKEFPVEPGDAVTALPYLPDLLAQGAALRDLPGTPGGALARAGADSPAGAIDYAPLADPNPRPGSATLVSFDTDGDWQNRAGIRLTLAEPAAGQIDRRPQWDPASRVLTTFLAKGQTAVTPLSTYLNAAGLKLMGQWEWLRQYIELITLFNAKPQYLMPGEAVDKINHVLQRAMEGGHWMLNPPILLTLVHAVQQPIGRPHFMPLNVDHDDEIPYNPDPLHTAAVRNRQDPVELAPITAWRRLGSTDAYLMGALGIHGASSAQIDLHAAWAEPLDDPEQPAWSMVERSAHVETIPLPTLHEDYVRAPGVENRAVGYYDPEHDQIAFVRYGDQGGPLDQGYGNNFFSQAAPRHQFADTKRRRVAYTAVAASRYREYFPTDAQQVEAGLKPLDFTRRSQPVVVDVPASERPLAPGVAYVLPTFGWQRQTETNVKRSVRFGGGLRVYLERGWFSSGEGELLGVALWGSTNGVLDAANRDKFKAYFTQWGMDPIWKTAGLGFIPSSYHFPDHVAADFDVSLEERNARLADGRAGRVNVVGFPVTLDPERNLLFADLTIKTDDATYAPFVRLALVRYQPHALADARISRVVLADFAQLTPDRSVLITVDPQAPRQLRMVVSGVAPQGPAAALKGEAAAIPLAPRPTQIQLRVQRHAEQIVSDLAWEDAPAAAQVTPLYDAPYPGQPDLAMWAGVVTFAPNRPPGRYRLLIEEYEHISADYTVTHGGAARQAGRLIFAETIELDEVLLLE